MSYFTEEVRDRLSDRQTERGSDREVWRETERMKVRRWREERGSEEWYRRE